MLKQTSDTWDAAIVRKGRTAIDANMADDFRVSSARPGNDAPERVASKANMSFDQAHTDERDLYHVYARSPT